MKNPHWFNGAAAACLLLPAVNASAVEFEFDLRGVLSSFGDETYTSTSPLSGGSSTVFGTSLGPTSPLTVSWGVDDSDPKNSSIVITVLGQSDNSIFQGTLDPNSDVSLNIFNLVLGREVAITSSTIDVIVDNAVTFTALGTFQDPTEPSKPGIGNGLDTPLSEFNFSFGADNLGNSEGGQDPTNSLEVTINYTLQDNGGGTTPTIPEPATLALLGLGLLGMGAARRRRT